MFIDETVVKVIAGAGGNGALAFRREKYVALGGPYGGNGGRGGNIVFKVDEGLNTLVDLKFKKIIKAKKGTNGGGKNMHGADANDVLVYVPMGTIIKDQETGKIIADLNTKEMEVVVAYGGRGGRGNTAFKTHANPAPNFSENGEPGEEKELLVELKMMADVGLVGLPSVGKSSIIRGVSASKAKVANYPFTTLVPNLGLVKAKDNYSFVIADLPGLIKGASQGSGLGDRFLRHIERTRVIAHVIDMASLEGNDPFDDYQIILNELKEFNPSLLERPRIIIANKMDLEPAKENLKKFKKKVTEEIFEVSALTKEGLEEVIEKLASMLKDLPMKELYEKDEQLSHVLYEFKEAKDYEIVKEGELYLIKGAKIEKIYKMTNLNTDEAILRFSRTLMKMGINDELLKMGIKKGDTVKILDFEMEFQ